MENETGLREEGEEATSPITERVQVPPRPTIARRKHSGASLPPSLGSLRPASLPNISAIHSSPPLQETTVRIATSEVEIAKRTRANGYIDEAQETEEQLDSREAEILRLVAASTPSHRAAWKKDSTAWRLFVNRQDQKARDQSTIEEEDEDTSTAGSSRDYLDDSEDESEVNGTQSGLSSTVLWHWMLCSRLLLGGHWSYYQTPIASSLPIPINFDARTRQSLGVPSYRPKTSLSDRPGMLVPPLRMSSDALRKAAYAERDRTRDLDPGALDFALEDDEEEEQEDVVVDLEVGSTGRQRALKIMQARDKIPAAG